jgi:hypothetical protein
MRRLDAGQGVVPGDSPAPALTCGNAPAEGRALGTLRTVLPNQASRTARWALRRGLWRVSKHRRLWHCGRHLHDEGGGTGLRIKDGSAYFDGIQTCGSIWVCPVCAARIRQRRALEIESAAFRHLEAAGGIGFGTFTLPHQRSDDLAALLDVVQRAWRHVQQQRAVREAFERLGITGRIRSTEITYGAWHGWHPHLHLLFFADEKLTERQWAELRDILAAAWAAAVVKLGAGRPDDQHGVTLGAVYAASVGQYLAKVQDHYGESSTIGLEMARGDAKKGRKRSRTPFEVAELAVAGVFHELHLWWEYESATKGRRAIEWSRGLKARFAIDDLEDDDLAAADVDGERLAWLDDGQWVLLVRRQQETHLLDLAEEGGAPAVHAFLAGLQEGAAA